MMEEHINVDILIVGAGPAGLSCAIRLAQLSKGTLQIALLEKASQVGGHILSGAVFNPIALNELLPNWRDLDLPLNTEVNDDLFYWLTRKNSYRLPVPSSLKNDGNYVISLSRLCQSLGQIAENMGIQIYAGFTGHEPIVEKERLIGIRTGPVGLDKQGNKTPQYQPGIPIYAKQTVLAEGAHGSLSQACIKKFKLRKPSQPQSYGIGLKEVWEVPDHVHQEGRVIHTMGWPLDNQTYGGGFVYHWDKNLVILGLIIGLDYKNTNLNTFQELQRMKDHPLIRSQIEDGTVKRYGARALNEGGWQALPTCAFKGGLLIGCAAGFLDNAQLKGSHTAMKSGIEAAEVIDRQFKKDGCKKTLRQFDKNMRHNWVGKNLFRSRNIRPGFYYGAKLGLLHAGIDQILLRGQAPWTWRIHEDHTQLKSKQDSKPINYPKPDHKYRFDLNSMLRLTGVYHEDNEPCHLVLRDPVKAIKVNYEIYDSPETRYCPARVYEIVDKTTQPRLVIHAQNCIHCKTCSIKDPTQNILWVTPQGGEGPQYQDT